MSHVRKKTEMIEDNNNNIVQASNYKIKLIHFQKINNTK